MNIALMNQRIIFQKNSVSTDKIGNHKNVWDDYFSCYATIGGEDGKSTGEKEVAGMTVENTDVSFSVRFCDKVDAVTEDGFRILFKGELYNITGIDHMNYKHKSVKFRCRKVRR